jgi:hydroxymethylpyrimidine pyrophosphatase-like HAD family hydrolase
MKKYLIFDLDGTLIQSNNILFNKVIEYIKNIDEEYIDKAKYIFNSKT